MNIARRKSISLACENLELLMEAEDEACSNLPESQIDGERGERMQENVELLNEAIQILESVVENG